jgi:amino acid transporter
MTNNKTTDQSFDGFSSAYSRYVEYITDVTTSKRKTLLIVSLVVIALLTTIGSLPISEDQWWVWVSTVISFPAGIILFAVLVGLQKTTKIQNWELSNFKINNSHLQRIRKVAILAAIALALLILFGHYMPYGLGGAIVVAVILIGYNLIRRTTEEIILAHNGIIDPRDINANGTVSQNALLDLNPDVKNGKSTDITNEDVK